MIDLNNQMSYPVMADEMAVKQLTLKGTGEGSNSQSSLPTNSNSLRPPIKKSHRFVDLTGKHFGKWTVISFAFTKNRLSHWNCICDCGTHKTIGSASLVHGRSTRCKRCADERLIINLSGKQFGEWTVLRYIGNRYWLCQCDCGKLKLVRGSHLRDGQSKQCRRCAPTTHGNSGKRLYSIWKGIIRRCDDSNHSSYHLYGGRGITICKEWKDDFDAFHSWAIQKGYADKLTIDRIDNDKGYEPSNCRWLTQAEQCNNTRSNINIEIDGITYNLAQLSKKFSIKYSTIRGRYSKGLRGKELLKPVKERM